MFSSTKPRGNFANIVIYRHCAGYGEPSQGAFQKYTVVQQDRIAELPYEIPTAVGVVLPLGISTAAAGLYQQDFLNLPLPTTDPESLDRSVLIWGGSSSVGSCCIQLAVASGAEVITTASPSNFEYCRKLGASQCFDYHDDDVEDQIVKALEGKTVVGAYHAVGADGAVQSCARIVDRTKGKAIVVTVRGVPDKGIPDSVRAKASMSPFLHNSKLCWANRLLQLARVLSSRTTSGRTYGASFCRRPSTKGRSYRNQNHSLSAKN